MRSTPLLGLALVSLGLFACAEGIGDAGDPYVGSGVDGGDASSGAGGSTGGSAGSTGGKGGSTGGTGGATGGTGGATGGTGGATGGTGGATGGTGGSGPCVAPGGGFCDLYPQSGCFFGDGCYVLDAASGMTDCAPNSGLGAGDQCTYLNDCAAGLSCIGSGCKQLCNVDSDCPGAGASCFQVTYDPGSGVPADVPCLKVCTDQCDPVNPSGVCSPGMNCDAQSAKNVSPGSSACYWTGSTNTGACSAANWQCAPGSVCVNDSTCRRWCKVNGTDCGATTCQAAGYYVGNQQYGFCP